MSRFNLLRILFDFILLVIIGIVLFAVPMDAIRPGAQLFLFKVLCVSAGFLHAHIIRKLAFPYIDFNADPDPYHKVLAIAIYVIVIWSYAHAG